LEPLNGGLRRTDVGHVHKAKAAGTAGVTIGNEIHVVHYTIRLKELAEFRIRSTKRKVTYKDIHAKVLFIMKSIDTIARSSEQYAGAQDASAICRRNGEEYPQSHKLCLMISLGYERYHTMKQ
jgi:hypothetical protein